MKNWRLLFVRFWLSHLPEDYEKYLEQTKEAIGNWSPKQAEIFVISYNSERVWVLNVVHFLAIDRSHW